MGAVEEDPFAAFLRPPPDETAEQRAQRLAQEAEAKKVNDMIDEQLKAERAALKKQKHVVRVLLLGQSESGRSLVVSCGVLNVEHSSWRQIYHAQKYEFLVCKQSTIDHVFPC
jgi:hypothetical protein